MNEIELKQKISEALSWADIYSALNIIAVFIVLVSFVCVVVFVFTVYTHYEQMDKDALPFSIKLLVTSFSFLVVFTLILIFSPSKSSKVAEAQAYVSLLSDTPANKVYIYSLSSEYRIYRELPEEEKRTESDVAVEVAQ